MRAIIDDENTEDGVKLRVSFIEYSIVCSVKLVSYVRCFGGDGLNFYPSIVTTKDIKNVFADVMHHN